MRATALNRHVEVIMYTCKVHIMSTICSSRVHDLGLILGFCKGSSRWSVIGDLQINGDSMRVWPRYNGASQICIRLVAVRSATNLAP